MPTPEETKALQEQEAADKAAKEAAEAARPADWETWFGAQDETVKELYKQHSENLLNTVKATRQERDALAKQIKELAKSQTEGSDARKALDAMGEKLEATERRAAFLEDATRPEVQCRNPRAAWLLADAGGHFDKHGRPIWDAIKAEAPELFGVTVAQANAGAGTGKPPSPAQNMNAFIRAMAGRK